MAATRPAFVLTALFAAGSCLWAQAPAETRPPSIIASGEATATAKPDQAVVDIGVVTQAQTAGVAAGQNASQLETVLNELRRVLGPGATLKTISYSLEPNYRYPKEGGRPTIAGYTARNVLQVKTDNLAAVPKVIDAATQSGANTIQSLQFTLKDEQALRAQALRDATRRARANAEAMAAALGLRISRILSIQQGEPVIIQPIRPMMARMAEAAAPPTPVEPGTIDVRATVTLTVEIAQ